MTSLSPFALYVVHDSLSVLGASKVHEETFSHGGGENLAPKIASTITTSPLAKAFQKIIELANAIFQGLDTPLTQASRASPSPDCGIPTFQDKTKKHIPKRKYH